jgi:selenium metabolism protein YedF
MANQKGYEISSEKTGDNEYTVILTVGDAPEETEEEAVCTPDMRGDTVVVISGDTMGDGDRELGETLLKGFIFALSKQEKLPSAMIFYNRGAFLTTEGSDSLEDLKSMEAMGVEILTCGTCLNHYGIAEKLCVGSVTNMYVIAEKMTGASKVVKPC